MDIHDKKWLICKGYIHIDMPFSSKKKHEISRYVHNANAIAHHSFLPLMHRVMKTYPFKISANGKRKCKPKKRELFFASHIDAAIYGFYSSRLQEKYEKILLDKNLGDVVTAYRKIKASNHYGNKSNIDFANDAFSYIRNQISEDNPLAVITFDIKGFFDNLDHHILKDRWKETLGLDELPKDWYQIYKHVTKYSWVEENEIFGMFKSKIKCKTKNGQISPKRILRKQYLRDKNAVASCEKSDIRLIRSHGLIHHRKEQDKVGIPQGLPISSTLANVYMLNFDLEAKQLLHFVGGTYRRYSDDIIVICPLCIGKYIEKEVISMIKMVKLTIEPHKTNFYSFKVENGSVNCEHDKYAKRKNLEYLGFSFDGNRILLKNSSVSKFYYKMHQAILRSIYFSIHINNQTKGKIFEYRLIKHYTAAGARTHRIYKRTKNKRFILSPNRSFGNYLTYAYKSADLMNSANIRHQVRRCSNKLSKMIKNAKVQIRNCLNARAFAQLCNYGRIY